MISTDFQNFRHDRSAAISANIQSWNGGGATLKIKWDDGKETTEFHNTRVEALADLEALGFLTK